MIFLFVLCHIATLASANSLANLLLQTRTNSNQNGYNNIPYNLPIQASNIQNYMPPNLNQNPVNFCSSNQPYGLQNGLPVQIKVEDTNKSYLNKILDNPMFQSILNPNANNFNENSNNLASLTHHGQTPNVINNYYIIPPECIQGNDKGIEMVKNLVANQQLVCKNEDKFRNSGNERKNNSRPQNKQNRGKVKPKSNKGVQNSGNNQRNLNNNYSQPRREKSKKKNNGNHRSSNYDRNQSKNKNVSNKNLKVNESNKENLAVDTIPSSRNGNRKRKKPKIKSGNDTQKANDALSIKNSPHSNELSEKNNSKSKKNQIKVLEHSRDDGVVNDIHKKFPGIPKDVIRRLLRYLRRQNHIKKICNGDGLKNSVEKISQDHIKTNANKRKNSRNNSRGSVNFDNTYLPTTTDNISATGNQTSKNDTEVLYNAELSQVETDLNVTENDEKSETFHYKPVEEVEEEITTNKITEPPNQAEDRSVLILENEVNDYYPDFRFDKMYMSEDDYIRNLRNDKFYYTTDKSKVDESSELYYKPYRPDVSKKEIESDEFEDTLNKPNKDYEIYDEDQFSNDFSSEETEFQTPPYLEHPDFETKPIVKQFDEERPVNNYQDNKNIDSINVKSSTYSNAKTVSAPLKDKPRNDDIIETVFAGSKVAKYGQQHQNIADPPEQNDNHDTVVVYARSMSET